MSKLTVSSITSRSFGLHIVRVDTRQIQIDAELEDSLSCTGPGVGGEGCSGGGGGGGGGGGDKVAGRQRVWMWISNGNGMLGVRSV